MTHAAQNESSLKTTMMFVFLTCTLIIASPNCLAKNPNVDKDRTDYLSPLQKTVYLTVGEEPKVTLRNIAGDIQIRRGTDNHVVIHYEKETGRVKVEINQDGDQVTVETVYPKETRTHGGVYFELQVPKTCDLDIDSISGDINLTRIQGLIQLDSISGNMEVEQCAGELELNTINGNVLLNDTGASFVDARTGSGRLTYRNGNFEDGEYRFSATSGDIELSHGSEASYEINGSSMTGKIRCLFDNDFDLATSQYTGFQTVQGTFNKGLSDLQAETISGDIMLRLD